MAFATGSRIRFRVLVCGAISMFRRQTQISVFTRTFVMGGTRVNAVDLSAALRDMASSLRAATGAAACCAGWRYFFRICSMRLALPIVFPDEPSERCDASFDRLVPGY